MMPVERESFYIHKNKIKEAINNMMMVFVKFQTHFEVEGHDFSFDTHLRWARIPNTYEPVCDKALLVVIVTITQRFLFKC